MALVITLPSVVKTTVAAPTRVTTLLTANVATCIVDKQTAMKISTPELPGFRPVLGGGVTLNDHVFTLDYVTGLLECSEIVTVDVMDTVEITLTVGLAFEVTVTDVVEGVLTIIGEPNTVDVTDNAEAYIVVVAEDFVGTDELLTISLQAMVDDTAAAADTVVGAISITPFQDIAIVSDIVN